MRTYSRKRTEFKELENVTEICRLCLEKPDMSVPIYSDNTKLYSSLALRIMVCVGLELADEEYMPKIICAQCHQDVQSFYLFRKKCAISYQKLKSHIKAVKDRERQERQNSMFTINPDGSILLKNNNNSSKTKIEPLVRLTKILYDAEKVHNSEVLLKTESSVSESTISNQLLNKALDQQPSSNQPLSAILADSKEQLFLRAQVSPDHDPEFSEFLSNKLTELGVLTHCGGGVVTLGPKTTTTLELETSDGNNITFELVEESEELEECPKLCPEEEGTIKSNKEEVATISAVGGGGGNGWRSGAKCEQCGKVLANRGVLARHVRNVHTRARPHACHACGRKFAQKEVLARHVLVHQERRPFQCDQCPKSFTQRSALEVHSRLHTGPQDRSLILHQCPFCQKIFLHASGLSRHLQHHSNIVVECSECGRQFADKSSLRRHQRNMRHGSHDDTSNKHSMSASNETSAVVSSHTLEEKSVAPASPNAGTTGG